MDDVMLKFITGKPFVQRHSAEFLRRKGTLCVTCKASPKTFP